MQAYRNSVLRQMPVVVGYCTVLFACITLNSMEYRLATTKDIPAITDLFANFSADDREKVLTFPLHMQHDIITHSVADKKFFVACEPREKSIVSFLKAYPIRQESLDAILEKELHVKPPARVLEDTTYAFPINGLVGTKKLGNPYTGQTPDDAILTPLQKALIRAGHNMELCRYLYYGSAYTVPAYRGHGLSSGLLEYALSTKHDTFKGKKFLALVYGQVLANISNHSMIRIFAHAIVQAGLTKERTSVAVEHIACCAYKPECDTQGSLSIIEDKAHEGRGSIVIYTEHP